MAASRPAHPTRAARTAQAGRGRCRRISVFLVRNGNSSLLRGLPNPPAPGARDRGGRTRHSAANRTLIYAGLPPCQSKSGDPVLVLAGVLSPRLLTSL